MRLLVLLASALSLPAIAAPAKLPFKPNRLLCRTGSENRAANQPLELFFQYDMPVVFEAEDPTVPYGRQALVLQGRPLMQLQFRKAAEPAGENGEKLEPMTCAFAKRVVSATEPAKVQIFMPAGQIHWLTQGIGQHPGPKQLNFERAVIAPAGDWSFTFQFDKVFTVELDDIKTFVTTQMPKAL